MRRKTAIMAGVLALAPVLAWAAEPMLVQIDGKTVAAHETSQVVQTAAGPAQVRTWRWQSPNGDASFVMQTSGSGASPATARQMQAQMQARMADIATLQASMQQQMHAMLALQQAAFGGMPAQGGMPLDAMFGAPPMVLMQAPRPVLYLVPVAPPAVMHAPAPAHAPAPPSADPHQRGVDI